jgi:hypothetical protein
MSAPRDRAWLAVVLVALIGLGCGRSEPKRDEPLTMEELRDTSGLSRGAAIVRTLEVYRMENGALRARGALRFPDGTRVQLVVYPIGKQQPLATTQFEVQGGRFDTAPMIGPQGPLPSGRYRFELLTYFESAWQPPEVLEKTNQGRDIRGPGITRGQDGVAAFYYTEELHR